MPSTAQQFRDRPIVIIVPGVPGLSEDLQLVCRRPDPLALIANGVLPLDTYSRVIEQLATWSKQSVAPDAFVAAVTSDIERYGDFLDKWACAAAVSPRLVLTREEADADAAALWIQDLVAIRSDIALTIYGKTKREMSAPRLGDAVADFRRVQSAGPVAGPDSAPVRDETVDPAASEGSAAGA